MLNPKKMPAHFSEQMYARQVRLVKQPAAANVPAAGDKKMTTSCNHEQSRIKS